MQAAQKKQAFEVMPENWYAVHVLDAMGTQWNVVASGRRLCSIGLRYEALPTVLSALRRTCAHARPLHELLPQLQQLEAFVLEIRNAE